MNENLQSLLSVSFPGNGDISLYAKAESGIIGLGDTKACGQTSRDFSCLSNCDRIILNIKTQSPLFVIGYDEWLATQTKRCDYVVCDDDTVHSRFALCELSCSDVKYVENHKNESGQDMVGKREKAYVQMMTTWEEITADGNPVLSQYILTHFRKLAVFGWREGRKVRPQKNNGAMTSMQRFSTVPGSSSDIIYYKDYNFGHSFTFIQVKYPAILNWDKLY